MKQIPDYPYCYMYRNIRDFCGRRNSRYLTEEELILIYKRTVHTAPRCAYEGFIKEMIEYCLIKNIVNTNWFIILDNKKTIAKFKKLKNHIFPLIS